MEQEELLASDHQKIFMVKNHHFDPQDFREDLEALRRLVAERDREKAVEHLRAMAVRY